MKTKFLLFAFLVIAFENNAQIPDWIWAKSDTGSNNDLGNSIATDSSGNVYVTGAFYGSSITFGGITLSNSGGADIFVVKYDKAGNVQWAKSGGSSADDYGNAIAADADGNVYITGSFKGTAVTFGSTTLINDTTDSTSDFFIVKYDTGGNLNWAKSAGGAKDDAGNSITCDAAGNIIVAGVIDSASMTFGSTTLTSPNGQNVFIVKYDAGGNVLWAKNSISVWVNDAAGITTDAGDNIYVTGKFSSVNLSFGSFTVTNVDTTQQLPDIFIVKYDKNGNVIWLKDAGGKDYDQATGIAADAAGNVFVTGYYFSDTIAFDNFVLINPAPGGDAFFVAKYNTNGNALWAKDVPEPYCDGDAIATDLVGNVYVAGIFSDSVTFGNTVLKGDTSITNYGDVFVVKYDANGNALWATSAKGDNYDQPNGVAIDIEANIYLTGYFQSSSITFGSTTLINDSITINGNDDFFIAKLSSLCSANFLLYPDTAQLHHYIAINMASGAGPLNYNWSWGDSAHDYIPYPSHNYADSGFYNICLTIMDSTGCTSTFCDSSFDVMRTTDYMVYINVVAPTTVGIKEVPSQIPQAIIYPNPAHNKLTVVFNSSARAQNIVSLYDVMGRVVLEKSFQASGGENKMEIDVSGVAQGVYVLRVGGENRKVVVE